MFNCKKQLFQIALLLLAATNFVVASLNFPVGKDSFKALNSDPANPLVMSDGISMSQTHAAANTVHPDSVLQEAQTVVKKMESKKAIDWLTNKDRRGYFLNALPIYHCQQGHTVDPAKLDAVRDAQIIDTLFADIASDKQAQVLTVSACPICQSSVKQEVKTAPEFDDAHKAAMLAQLQALGVNDQVACSIGGLPNFRLSLEAADVLQDGSDQIDAAKLEKQAEFIKALGNPMLFFHHYANPISKPHLFEDKKDVAWFANYCAEVLKKSPQVTHVCPISQPVGFAFRVTRSSLPPFHSNVGQAEYLENITNAQVAAAQAMKAVNPNVKVLVSHQWKSMKPMHTGQYDPRRIFESGICKIADMKYNQQFVKLMMPHMQEFDGIALSVYPAVRFDMVTPKGDNCAGELDYDSSLQAVVQTSKAFPGKDIYIVETGCNTTDPEKKLKFIDMMLHVCRVARDMGIPVKGLYFWGENNDPEFYREWGMPQGSTNFAPYDKLDPANPLASINAGGMYMQTILTDRK